MATQDSLDRVQALYVAYYGRPADQEGQAYWAERMDAEGEDAIINAFGTSEEYNDRFGEQTNANAVNTLYQQMFNRHAEPDGLTYWTGILSSGEKSLAEVATTIMNAARNDDRLILDAKIKAAAAYTEEFGAAEDYDLEAAIDAVENAKAGVNPSALTEALTTLKNAQTAEADFLEAQVDNAVINELLKAADDAGETIAVVSADGETDDDVELTKLSDDLNLEQLREAIEDVYNFAAEQVKDSTLLNDTTFETRSTAAQDLLIADAVAAGEKAVTEAEKDAKANVLSAIATVQQRATSLENGVDQENAAKKAFDVAVAAFEVESDAVNGIELTGDQTDTSDAIAEGRLADGSTLTITLADNSTVVLTFEGNGTWSVNPNDEDSVAAIDGLDAILALGNTWGTATINTNTAMTSLQNGIDAALSLQTETTVTDGGKIALDIVDGSAEVDVDFEQTQLDAILTARENLIEFNEAVAEFQAIRDIRDEAESLADDVDDALEAIEDADGLNVDVWTAADIAADTIDVDSTPDVADDVVLFSKDFDGVAISNFGNVGEDRLFFGDEYSLVQLSSADGQKFTTGDGDFSSDVGSASDLEIFWTQNGVDVELFVETKAFAGNSTGGSDFVQITLAGVNSNDIEFSGGYLTVGEPA